MESDNQLANCMICINLSDQETASQKYGWEESDTFLPEEYTRLVLVKDLRPDSFRKMNILECPLCRTFYLFSTDYDYLVNGSEDEQKLIRITKEEADRLINQYTDG